MSILRGRCDRVERRLHYDLIHVRFLLTHLREPQHVLSRMLGGLKPGGVAVVEDIDFSGHVCYPASEAFDFYVRMYQEVVRRRGGDANIGPKLPGLLLQGGFDDVSWSLPNRFS